MSVDLEWDDLLQSSLSSSLVDILNRHLAATSRPSFIGPVSVTSLDFGCTPPDVEVVDIRDIYRDFLEDDDGGGLNAGTDSMKVGEGGDDVDGFEWVSRRATSKLALAEESPVYHHLPPHVRYGKGPSSETFGIAPRSPMDIWNNGTTSTPNLRDLHPTTPLFRSMLSTPSAPFSGHFPFPPSLASHTPPTHGSGASRRVSSESADTLPPSTQNQHPNLQLHLRITYESDLRLTLTTSLLINYPSPSFMSLPIKLSITGLIFTGEIVVAYEGARQRVHLCILDDLDPYGPAGDRSNRRSSGGSTPLVSDSPPRAGKPLPIGLRLLPSIFIESEIGQADKHVLKNVTRVERFIQDVIRKTVEEELLFPNYHTLILGDQ